MKNKSIFSGRLWPIVFNPMLRTYSKIRQIHCTATVEICAVWIGQGLNLLDSKRAVIEAEVVDHAIPVLTFVKKKSRIIITAIAVSTVTRSW